MHKSKLHTCAINGTFLLRRVSCIEGAMIGMMIGASAVALLALIEGGTSAFVLGGEANVLRFLGTNLVKNYFLSWLTGFGLTLRGAMTAQSSLNAYGQKGFITPDDVKNGVFGMECGTKESLQNIINGSGSFLDYLGIILWFTPVGDISKGEAKESANNADRVTTPQEEGSVKSEEETVKTSLDTPTSEDAIKGDGEALEKGISEFIAADGYRTGTERIEAGTRNIGEADFSIDGIEAIDAHLRKPEISNNGELFANNKIMMERMIAISEGRLKPTANDQAFYTHELRESQLMDEGLSYSDAHAQACKEFGIDANAEKNDSPFYTDEANKAWEDEELANLKRKK